MHESDGPGGEGDSAAAGRPGCSRREFLQGAASAAGVAGSAGTVSVNARVDAVAQPLGAGGPAQVRQHLALRVNGAPRELTVEPRLTLLDALRDQLDLTGTKKGCDRGQCGACTVLVNGRRINACLTLAVMHEGDEVTTIEGLAGADGTLHPMQRAFLEHDAFQCGFCTPGQIISAVALVEEVRKDPDGARPTDADLREGMSGNLCRCGAYTNILAAVRSVLDRAHG
jgi:xanthine dehydrogenase YagT iron-sulfur-binding subunit